MSAARWENQQNYPEFDGKQAMEVIMRNFKVVGFVFLIVLIGLCGTRLFKSIPAGHVGVATLFGKVQENTFGEGLNVPVNPFFGWVVYDARQKTHTETATVPSQDQLNTSIDVSVQYRVNKEMAAFILRDTGTAQQAVEVHLMPKLRSLLREQGKSVKRAEDFFLETTQQTLQASLSDGLRDFLQPKGIAVESVLIREIRLPAFITKAIEQKKEREQEAEKQKAELERYKTEQEQLLVQAEAARKAAEEEAKKIQLLADAQAYEIEKINEAISNNPAYIQLEALKALTEISKDPAAKLYFLNADSPQPLPLMHMGGDVTTLGK